MVHPFLTLETPRELWWILLYRGILSVLFGVFAVLVPGVTLQTIIMLFGALLIAEGLLVGLSGLESPSLSLSRRYRMVRGVIEGLVGLLFLLFPVPLTAIAFQLLGILFIFVAVFELMFSLEMRKLLASPWVLYLSAALWGVLGLLIFQRPFATASLLFFLVGVWFLVSGMVTILCAWRMRRMPPQIVLEP